MENPFRKNEFAKLWLENYDILSAYQKQFNKASEDFCSQVNEKVEQFLKKKFGANKTFTTRKKSSGEKHVGKYFYVPGRKAYNFWVGLINEGGKYILVFQIENIKLIPNFICPEGGTRKNVYPNCFICEDIQKDSEVLQFLRKIEKFIKTLS